MDRVTLVLLPGLDGTGLLFEPLLRVLPQSISPVVVRYPPDQPLDYEQLLPIVLNSLPANEPFVLLGESFSGPLALMATATDPPGLKAVVLAASFATKPVPYVPAFLGKFLRPWMFRPAPLLVRLKTLLPSRSELRELLVKANSLVAPEVWMTRIRAVLSVNVVQQLRCCKVPILYLKASDDCVVPTCNARLITQQRPDVRVTSIKAPHLLLQTRPAEAAEAICSFVQQNLSALL
jgi:pimeloyl-[acyl-carrier protein] methyl ester esterase